MNFVKILTLNTIIAELYYLYKFFKYIKIVIRTIYEEYSSTFLKFLTEHINLFQYLKTKIYLLCIKIIILVIVEYFKFLLFFFNCLRYK